MTTTPSTKSRPLVLALGLLASLLVSGGCPLQTPTYDVDELQITASATMLSVGQKITLAASAGSGASAGVDLATATWFTSDATIVSLGSMAGASVIAQAVKAGRATISVAAGVASSSLTITVLP